jgi:hypothetical protein
VRNTTLFSILEAFTADSALQLSARAASGEEIPFELIETDGARRGRVPLYCYRPLTGAFIRERVGLLSALPSYAPAARALTEAQGTEAYLRLRGETRIPAEGRERADAALRCFLARVFEERSEFDLDPQRLETAYEELERALYDGRCVTTVIAPLLGIALDPDTAELPLGDGLALVQGATFSDAPAEAVWGAGGPEGFSEEPNVLACLTVTGERSARPPVSIARARFRRILTALRLFERGGYALGPLAWTRVDDGTWRSVAFGASGRPRFVTLIPATEEDELRAFYNLVMRRSPSGRSGAGHPVSPNRPALDLSGYGEMAWALSRFEMGCERLAPFEALTDHLLALRALLEPEGPGSGRLAQRLAVLCAQPEDRAALAERTAHVISLERAVIAGLGPGETDPAHPVDALVDEVSEHLRALLRDVICGHLDADLRGIADSMLAEAAAQI